MKRPSFALGQSGGCGCPSCSLTSEYISNGFAAWPRGNPAGRRSAAAYAAHVAHGKKLEEREFSPEMLTIRPEPRFSASALRGLVMPIPAPSKAWQDYQKAHAVDWGAMYPPTWKRKGPAVKPALARPETPCKASQNFPHGDRTEQAARIYAMPKSEASQHKRGRGRPGMPGRRVVIKLEEEQIKRASKLGGGNVAEGIRRALAKTG